MAPTWWLWARGQLVSRWLPGPWLKGGVGWMWLAFPRPREGCRDEEGPPQLTTGGPAAGVGARVPPCCPHCFPEQCVPSFSG